jgi:hypothetical protein
MIRKKLLAGVAVLALALAMAPGAWAMKGAEGHMKMHHLHMLMNHGVGMATEGATLVMIAGMKMTPPPSGTAGGCSRWGRPPSSAP